MRKIPQAVIVPVVTELHSGGWIFLKPPSAFCCATVHTSCSTAAGASHTLLLIVTLSMADAEKVCNDLRVICCSGALPVCLFLNFLCR